MTHHSFTRTLLLGCMLIAFSGAASADVVQCIDNSGKVTYTDVPCKAGTDAAAVSTSAAPSAEKSRALSPKEFVLAQKAREATWAKKPASDRSFPVDMATAKMARASFLEIDEERTLLRQQKLAALN